MKVNKKNIVFIIVAAALVGVAVVVPSIKMSGHRQAVETGEERDTVFLNRVIDNEMSQFSSLKKMDAKIERYMQYWHLHGAQLAVMRNDSLLFCKGYGIADDSFCHCETESFSGPAAGTAASDERSEAVEMTPGNILRIASVSKLITAAGIMKMQEDGLIHLSDTVFGPGGILCDSLYTDAIRYMNDYSKITVEHLLRHQAGFRRDPVFSANDVREQMRLDCPPSLDDYSRLVLSRRLRYEPGGSQTYSNYGYMLLSRIIEKVSEMSYEDYIQQKVLHPAGCWDMHIADNYYEGKRPNEVRYYVHEGDGKEVREYNGSGRMVERCYGGNDISLLQGAGAWVCSAAELAKFVASIDYNSVVKNILSKESIDLMTEYTDSSRFSLGWNDTNPRKGWVRTGTLAGTNAVIKYYPDGECWIWLTNTSTWKGPSHAKYTSTLFDRLRHDYSSKLPVQNLFEQAK